MLGQGYMYTAKTGARGALETALRQERMREAIAIRWDSGHIRYPASWSRP